MYAIHILLQKDKNCFRIVPYIISDLTISYLFNTV
jgi:hypothetical protein